MATSYGDWFVHIKANRALLEGALQIPEGAIGLVLFAHGSGSSRHSPRNKYVADTLHANKIGTLLFDLLTPDEDTVYERRFDIALLTKRLLAATRWAREQPQTKNLPLGYFGASTGAAAALKAAAGFSNMIKAVVSRGGRPDLALDVLVSVRCPTLLIVGGYDTEVLRLNELALKRLGGVKALSTVPQATHLFEEPGALEEVARLAADWFTKYLTHYEVESSIALKRKAIP